MKNVKHPETEEDLGKLHSSIIPNGYYECDIYEHIENRNIKSHNSIDLAECDYAQIGIDKSDLLCVVEATELDDCDSMNYRHEDDDEDDGEDMELGDYNLIKYRCEEDDDSNK